MDMKKRKTYVALARMLFVSAGLLQGVAALAQQVANMDFVSVGRGAPLNPAIPGQLRTNPVQLESYPAAEIDDYPEQYWMVGPFNGFTVGADGIQIENNGWSALNGNAPDGVDPLPVDLFTSEDFYADQSLWSDPRYFRCNSSESIQAQWAVGLIGDNPPRTAAWGYCDRDYPREAIISPYPFQSAESHYEALLAETQARGGPTQHTYATVPGDWNGRYVWPRGQNWYAELFWNQVPTILSLLTEEYQTRMVQEAYHHGNTNISQWPAQFCWPEGYMRRWHYHGVTNQPHQILVTPELVQILAGDADNFITNIHIGRSFNVDGLLPRLGADVPRWYGETIGFWDGEVLITWTSNTQGWKVHGSFEFSNKMQVIEIYTANRDEQGEIYGLNHEGIFYDPEALVEPIRIVRNLERQGGLNDGDPYQFIECVQSIFNINGVPTPASPGQVIEYTVPDMYGRPWAENWQKFHEQDMERPEEEDLFSFE
ncbi:MAG: hypothetical protein P8M72_11705 [Gammaproteobacteria bacterium]|nr:hypothetical protein [Gammaproteobacteria bacterium]